MPFRYIFFILVSILLVLLIVTNDKPERVIVVTTSNMTDGQKTIYDDMDDVPLNTQTAIDTVKEAIDSGDGLDDQEVHKILNLVDSQLKEYVELIDATINELENSSEDDSQAYTEWKQRYKNCLLNLKAEIESIDTSNPNAKLAADKVYQREGKKPCGDIADEADNLPDQNERNKARNTSDNFNKDFGRLLILLSLIAAAYGDFETAYLLYSLGNDLLKGDSGGDGSEPDTGGDNITEKPNPIPKELADKYDSYGGSNGEYSFLISKNQENWMLIKLIEEGNHEELLNVSIANTSNLQEGVFKKENLKGCQLKVVDEKRSLTMAGEKSCLNFSLNWQEGGSWLFSSNAAVKD